MSLARDLLDCAAVFTRLIESVGQGGAGFRVDHWLVEPENLDEARGNHTKPPLPAAAVPQKQRDSFSRRIVLRYDIVAVVLPLTRLEAALDRKSTRLNSSH